MIVVILVVCLGLGEYCSIICCRYGFCVVVVVSYFVLVIEFVVCMVMVEEMLVWFSFCLRWVVVVWWGRLRLLWN